MTACTTVRHAIKIGELDERRPDPARRRRDRRGGLAAVLRRIPRHRHRRRHDPRPAVHALCSSRASCWWPPRMSRRRTSIRTASTALCSCPSSVAADTCRGRASHRAYRFPAGKARRQPTWYVPADEDAEVALDVAWQRFTGAVEGGPMDLQMAGRICTCPKRPWAWRASPSASYASSRSARATICGSRANSTRSSSIGSR